MGLRLLLLLLICLFPLGVKAQESASFVAWFDGFAQEAITQGITPTTLQSAIPLFTYDESVIELDRKQPEGKITFAQYLKNTLPQSRIEQASELLSENNAVLARIEQRTGVPASIIVALWGIESNFGENMGDYDVITSLATLAYEGRRADFFKGELIHALAIIQEEGRRPETLKGSWAGAMGQCQFMPSTYRRFAVDDDQDGMKDIWNDTGDTLASIANYLVAEGWRPNLGWGSKVKLTLPIPASYVGLDTQQTVGKWRELGVLNAEGEPLPELSATLSLIQPDGPTGPSYLVTENYRAIMKWNRSTYFATTVGLFADKLATD